MITTPATPDTTGTASARHRAPAQRNTGRTIAIAVASVLAAGGVAAGLVFGLGATPAPAPAPVAQAASVGVPVSPVAHQTIAPVTPTKPVTPPVAPSAAITTLQQQLGRLNYYEGPVTGIMNTQTTQAITYLQRDAHLPQTGTMNSATQAALANFLAHGNNQMAG